MKIRPQYHFRSSTCGLHAWDVRKLIQLSKELTVKQVQLANITDIDSTYWYDKEGDTPTCRSIVSHMTMINSVDLKHPIILSHDGRVMDGMHRICKALLLNQQTIAAVQFETKIPPDFVNIKPEDLAYDE
jgi:hypothetical protein